MQRTTSVLIAFEAYQKGKVVKHRNGEFLCLEAKRKDSPKGAYQQNDFNTKGE